MHAPATPPASSPDDAREALRESLAQRLRAARRAGRTHEEAELVASLRALATPHERKLPALALLPRLRIASPCTEDWDAMSGDRRARLCSQCDRHVFDLTGLRAADAEALILAHLQLPEARLPCVRLYRRADGTLLTDDCATGPAPRASIAAWLAAGATVTVLAAAIASAPLLPRHALDRLAGDAAGAAVEPFLRVVESIDANNSSSSACMGALATDEKALAYLTASLPPTPSAEPLATDSIAPVEAPPPPPSRPARPARPERPERRVARRR